jgi:hypothetical protein
LVQLFLPLARPLEDSKEKEKKEIRTRPESLAESVGSFHPDEFQFANVY